MATDDDWMATDDDCMATDDDCMANECHWVPLIVRQTETFGSDHIYQADTFNELAPPTDDPTYLRASSAAVYAAMAAADPSAIWLMQGWLFQSAWWQPPAIEAYLGGVPRGSMWLLDLFGDSNPIWSKTASYDARPPPPSPPPSTADLAPPSLSFTAGLVLSLSFTGTTAIHSSSARSSTLVGSR